MVVSIETSTTAVRRQYLKKKKKSPSLDGARKAEEVVLSCGDCLDSSDGSEKEAYRRIVDGHDEVTGIGLSLATLLDDHPQVGRSPFPSSILSSVHPETSHSQWGNNRTRNDI